MEKKKKLSKDTFLFVFATMQNPQLFKGRTKEKNGDSYLTDQPVVFFPGIHVLILILIVFFPGQWNLLFKGGGLSSTLKSMLEELSEELGAVNYSHSLLNVRHWVYAAKGPLKAVILVINLQP